jgi:hypothetical protein
VVPGRRMSVPGWEIVIVQVRARLVELRTSRCQVQEIADVEVGDRLGELLTYKSVAGSGNY